MYRGRVAVWQDNQQVTIDPEGSVQLTTSNTLFAAQRSSYQAAYKELCSPRARFVNVGQTN
jgi:hypothetical protein